MVEIKRSDVAELIHVVVTAVIKVYALDAADAIV